MTTFEEIGNVDGFHVVAVYQDGELIGFNYRPLEDAS